jgi:hypothetical protein
LNYAFAVEANHLIAEIPEFDELMRSDSSLADVNEWMYLYHEKSAAEQAANLCREAGLLEEVHPLVCLKNGMEGELFADYGFKVEKRVYLFKDLVCAFILESSDLQDANMAKLQIAEHLVASESPNSSLFFVDRELSSLMDGIAQAYGCKLSFLDLDK